MAIKAVERPARWGENRSYVDRNVEFYQIAMDKIELSKKEEAFVNEYFLCNMKGTEAARRLGSKQPRLYAHRMITNANVSAEINRHLKERQLSAEEVLARISDLAASDIVDFADVRTISDLKKDEYKGKTHVIKKFKSKITRDALGRQIEEVELELYGADGLLDKMARYHGLYNDKIEISWRDKLPPDVDADEVKRQFVAIMQQAAHATKSD